MSAQGQLESVLEALTDLLEQARAMPLSESCLVNREEALTLVDDVRALLPDAMAEADRVIASRDELLDHGRREAERLVAERRDLLEQATNEAELILVEAEQEQARLVAVDEVFRRAVAEADEVLEQARADAEDLLAQAEQEAEERRRQTEDYVDGKLAQFETLLASTLTAVERGRARLGRPTPDEAAPDVAR